MQLAPKLGTELRLEPTLRFGIGVGLYTKVILISYEGLYITVDAQSFIFGGCALYAIFSFTLVQGRWNDT
jgi:hypothetical protein